jgi:hypothetical protein
MNVNRDKKISSLSYLLDKAGMWTSAICAIHCIALPMLITASAFSGLVFLNDPRIENSILAGSVLIGTGSLFPSYFHHRKIFPLLVLLFGFLLIGLSRFMVNDNESVLVASGAASVASAHFLNFRFCRTWYSRGK